MPARKSVTRQIILEAALRIIVRDGASAMTMRELGRELGIKAPSLYDHVNNRDAVLALVQAAGLESFGAGFAAAGPSVREKVLFYRQWALDNTNLYPVVFQNVLHRALLPEGLESGVLKQVVAAAGGSHLQARVMWAQLHGLVDLELQGRLPSDADTAGTWDQAVKAIELMRESISKSSSN